MNRPDEGSARKGWLWLVFVIVSGVFFAFFHNMYVAVDFNQRNIDALSAGDNPAIEGRPELLKREKLASKGREAMLVWSGEKNLEVPVSLKEAEAQRVRVIGYFPKVTYGKADVIVSVNGKEIQRLTPKWDAGFEKFSFNVASNAVRAGENAITIGIDGQNRYLIGYELINLRNYAGKNRNFPKASIQFDENYAKAGKKPLKRPLDYILFPSILFLLWIAAVNLVRHTRNIPMKDAFKRVFYFNLPVALIFAGLYIFTAASPYTLVIDYLSFLVFVIAPCAALICSSLLVIAYRKLTDAKSAFSGDLLKRRLSALGQSGGGERVSSGIIIFKRIARHSGTVAIIAFIVFLGLAGGFLIFKKQGIAERLADIAYFSLVFGVLTRIFEVRETK